MAKTPNAIQFDAPYLVCMNCGDKCDATDRYTLQVDHIITIKHQSHRVFFDVCAACYRDLFPWKLDWIDNV